VKNNETNPDRLVGPEVLGWVLEHHAAALELYARQLCPCAEDVVQEALIQLAGQAAIPQDVVAWLYRVVRNRALNAARSARRRQRHERLAAQERPNWLPRPTQDGWDAQVLTAALEALTRDDREIVVAHVWGRLSFQQIGQLLGTSNGTAHRRYVTALKTLRRRLEVPCPETT
jgi:RNA polymerase sigma factor (sigma-70 family)